MNRHTRPKGISEWPWERSNNPPYCTPDNMNYLKNYELKHPKFISISYENMHFDEVERRAAIKASQSVVSLVSYSDDKEIFQGTGTIIDDKGTILTSAILITHPTSKNKAAKRIKFVVYLWDETSYEAKLLAYDFYYGIAVVKIKPSGTQFKPACLRHVDDCVSLELSDHDDNEDSQLRPDSNAYNLVPGDKVIALGRYFIKPYDLMAAPGKFSIKRIDDEDLECKELFRADCDITTSGIGGPMINQYGEVIGIASNDNNGFTPFVPLNVALKWWKHYKEKRPSWRPLFGMKMANLYTADLHFLEKLTQKFPNYFAGVIVEEVIQGLSADIAGICSKDVIVKCCGKSVRSFLEFFDMMWDKAGDSVELVVLRSSDDAELDIKMEVVNANKGNKCKKSKKRIRS